MAAIRERLRSNALVADAVRAARRVRDRRRPPVPTPYGFSLRGAQRQGGEDFEPAETAVLLELLPAVDVFVDVGANIGRYSCLARSRDVAVIAVEPLPANVELLLANLADNGWSDVLVLPLALGAHDGIAPMFGGGTGASLTAGWAGVRTARPTLVPVATADDEILPRIGGRRAIVKVDVEGAELDLLAGAERLLRSEPAPTWLIEVVLDEHHPAGRHPAFARVMEAFWDAEYTIETVPERRVVTGDDVAAWVQDGRVAFGSYSYLCRRT
jgi:FkbM family methyltransferase